MMWAQAPGGNKRRHFDDNFILSGRASDGGCSIRSFDSYGIPDVKRINHGSRCGRKEKKDNFSEKVSALQQLVCPFGKTDTASVLQEATGYIRFLHDQVQVLSAPYICSHVSENTQAANIGNLRSRGLCMMPISWTLKLAKSNGADIWAPMTSSKHQ